MRIDPVKEIDTVLERVGVVRAKPTSPETLYELEALELAAIRRLAPIGTTYRQQAEAIEASAAKLVPDHPNRGAHVTQPLRGVLMALRHDYEKGLMTGVEELIHADLFEDFLDMADHLLSEGYKDPAAVITGGVLETHLRKLADRNSIALSDAHGPRKASALNDDLLKAQAYGKLDHKNVLGWLQIRNDAAHADWQKYNSDQVRLLIDGVREFVARLPA